MSRFKWQYRPAAAEGIIQKFEGLVEEVFIGHTAIVEELHCFDYEGCRDHIRKVDRMFDVMTWPEIIYNFVIGGYEQAFIGRGWEKQGTITNGKISVGYVMPALTLNEV